MKIVKCNACGCFTRDQNEVEMMERGELDNRCPLCKKLNVLSLSTTEEYLKSEGNKNE